MLSVVQSGQNWNSSKILYISFLSASLKRIRSIATDKKWRHGFFLDIQGQLTLLSVVKSGRNSKTFTLLWLSVLPTRMKEIY